MLRLGELDRAGLGRMLRSGLPLRAGPFVFRVRSPMRAVRDAIATLYADATLAPDAGFHDFHVEVRPVRGLRRWIGQQVQFYVDGTAPFLPLPAGNAYAFLEWGMNWCVAGRAHHALLLHAAVLERGGRAVVLPGEPGAGKSTLAAALMLGGWRLLSDEMAIVDLAGDRIHGMARPVNLKNASIDLVRRRWPDAVFGEVFADTHKGTVSHLRPPAGTMPRAAEPAAPGHIVFPRWSAGAATSLQPLARGDAFMRAAGCAFNYSLLGRAGFLALGALVSASDCWAFEYAELDQALAAFEGLAA